MRKLLVCAVAVIGLVGCYVPKEQYDHDQAQLRKELAQVFGSMGVRDDRTMYWAGQMADPKQTVTQPGQKPAEPPKK